MAIHRISAKDKSPSEPQAKEVAKSKQPPKKAKKTTKTDKKALKSEQKTVKATKAKKLPLPLRILLAPTVPFRALGRYIRDSWREIRQVRWPDRKLTWKMTLSVILYVIVFAAVIMLLDALFAFLFNKLLGV